MIRIVLAVIGGIIASVAVAVIEGSVGAPSFSQFIVMMGVIALILLLTGSRRPATGDGAAELLQQLDHHRRELYRLEARHQRKGALTAAEARAWFRNKRTLGSIKKQLQNAGTPYEDDAIDAAPPPPMDQLTRVKEFIRQPAVSLFTFFFLVSLALGCPLSMAAQSIFESYLSPALVAGEVEQQSTVNGQQSTVNGQQLTASSQQPTVNSQQLTVNSQQSTANSQQSTVNNFGAATSTRTPSPTHTAVATTARATPTATATATHTSTPTVAVTEPASAPPGTPLPPAPAATATFLPAGTLPAGCGEGRWEVEPNNTFETAQGPLAIGAIYCGYLNDSYDFYYVEVSAPGRLTVSLENTEMEPGRPPLNLLKLFTAGRAPIDWCCLSRRNRIELTIDVRAGRYYILVDAREIVGIPYLLHTGYQPADN